MRVKFNMVIPSDIERIQRIFKQNGFKLFLVGGAVRDAFLGIEPKDFDLATDALPDEVQSMMKDNGLRTIATGEAFGVINVFTENNEFEIATFRADIGSGRRPEGVKFTTIEGDVLRRDLTCNALFFDLETNEIVDLVGGIDDLSKGIVRTVGPADDRFSEDRLRILRAIRFASRFGTDLDSDIVNSLKNNSSLEGISSERIRDEFIKGIKTAKSVRRFIKMLFDFNLFSEIFLPNTFIDPRVGESRDHLIVLAMLLRHVDVDVLKNMLNQKSFTRNEIKGITFLTSIKEVDGMFAIELKKQQKNSGLSNEQIREFSRLVGINGVFIDLFLEFNLTVTGQEIMEATGIGPGPEIGLLVNAMEVSKFSALFS